MVMGFKPSEDGREDDESSNINHDVASESPDSIIPICENHRHYTCKYRQFTKEALAAELRVVTLRDRTIYGNKLL